MARVRIADIPLWGRFRRLGSHPGLGWIVRMTERDYCDLEDVKDARKAVARYPTRPGPEMYKSVDQLLALPRKDFECLSLWNRFYSFREADFQRADKKDFIVPEEV